VLLTPPNILEISIIRKWEQYYNTTFGLVRAYLVLDSPITNSSTAGKYWGIDATIQYGGSNGSDSVDLANTVAGLVDTGTTIIYLSTGTLLCNSRFLPDMRIQTHNTLLR
jgi:hypothetical protein